MGKQLVGFLIWNCYGSGRLIPYWVMTATRRGNGCLQKDPKNDRWCSRRFKSDEQLSDGIIEFRNTHCMIDLVELVYFGSFGIKYKSKETVEVEGDGSIEVVIEKTLEETEVDIL